MSAAVLAAARAETRSLRAEVKKLKANGLGQTQQRHPRAQSQGKTPLVQRADPDYTRVPPNCMCCPCNLELGRWPTFIDPANVDHIRKHTLTSCCGKDWVEVVLTHPGGGGKKKFNNQEHYVTLRRTLVQLGSTL